MGAVLECRPMCRSVAPDEVHWRDATDVVGAARSCSVRAQLGQIAPRLACAAAARATRRQQRERLTENSRPGNRMASIGAVGAVDITNQTPAGHRWLQTSRAPAGTTARRL